MIDKKILDYLEKNKQVFDIDYAMVNDKAIIKKMDFEIILSENLSYEVKINSPILLGVSLVLTFIGATLIFGWLIGLAVFFLFGGLVVYQHLQGIKYKKEIAESMIKDMKKNIGK